MRRRRRRTPTPELRPQRERREGWPALLVAVIGAVVTGVFLWRALAPGEAGSAPAPAIAALLTVAMAVAATVAIWAIHAAPRRLDYRLRGRTLVITTLLGRRTVPLRSVTAAEQIDFDLKVGLGLHLGWPRSHLPGYYVGRFPLSGLGRTLVVVAVRRGRGVLLRPDAGAPVLLAPKDPDALVGLVERRGR